MSDYDLTYLSFGAGVQSTALLILSNLGERGVPRADVAIFADTGDEPKWVYENLERLKAWSGIPVEVVSAGSISEDIYNGKNFATIPAFSMDDTGVAAPLRRQCTREYKIAPIERRVRELLGYKKGQHVKKPVRCMIGISLDEVSRCAPCRTSWIDNVWPLIDARIDRGECARIAEREGFTAPGKSSCYHCPYHSDRYWRNLRDSYPNEWRKAVRFDKQIRNMTKAGAVRPLYLHRSLRPLDQVEFRGEGQLSMWDEECAGVCGV